MTVIEPKSQPCDLCHAPDSFYMTLCKQPEGEEPSRSYFWNGEEIPRAFMLSTCRDCHDKIPYETIPIKTSLGEGYFYCPYVPEKLKPVVVETHDFTKGITTRYGKKLLAGQRVQ